MKRILTVVIEVAMVAATVSAALSARELPDNRKLGIIFNCEIDGLLYHSSGKDTSPAEYRQMVRNMLGYGMRVLAYNVGTPDPVTYCTSVGTTWDKYITEVCRGQGWTGQSETDWSGDAMKKLLAARTDPLQLTIEMCRETGVVIVASYGMNAEDFYDGELDLSDFDRAHKNLAIPGASCLDPVHPEVYAHRMAIFREVAGNYDIDGIEFDFRRLIHMISDPLQNHTVLTRMVAETRQMLDELAKKKGRKRLLLGVRVAGSLDTPENVAQYPGAVSPGADPSCKEVGLDVKTWMDNGYVDYVCPSLFWPRLPGVPHTRQFVALAKGTKVGIYPSVFPLPVWAEDEKKPVYDSLDARRRQKDEIVQAALECYADGADGISTFNWNRDDPDHPAGKKREYAKLYGRGSEGFSRVSMQVCRKLASPKALRKLLKTDPPTAGLPLPWDRGCTHRSPTTFHYGREPISTAT